jgi:hypothetical protein
MVVDWLVMPWFFVLFSVCIALWAYVSVMKIPLVKKKKKKEGKGMLNKKSKGQVTVVGNNINQAATKTNTKTNRFLLSSEKVTRHH